MIKKVKRGDKFLCIKDVIMNEGVLAYIKGNVYVSERDECITDEQEDVCHGWTKEVGLNDYFTFFADKRTIEVTLN